MKRKSIDLLGTPGKGLASAAADLAAALVLGLGVTACEDGGGGGDGPAITVTQRYKGGRKDWFFSPLCLVPL